jgi:hypothetical protein
VYYTLQQLARILLQCVVHRYWAEYCVACTAKKSVHGGMVLSIVQQHTNTKVHKYTLIHSDAYIIAGTRTYRWRYMNIEDINKRPPKNPKPKTTNPSILCSGCKWCCGAENGGLNKTYPLARCQRSNERIFR